MPTMGSQPRQNYARKPFIIRYFQTLFQSQFLKILNMATICWSKFMEKQYVHTLIQAQEPVLLTLLSLENLKCKRDQFKMVILYVFGAEGSKLHISAVSDISLNITGLMLTQKFYVVDNLFESSILGSDFIHDNQLKIHYSNKVVSLCADLVRMQLINDGDQQFIARLNKTLCIPAGCEQIVDITCSHFSNRDVLVEPITLNQFSKFAVACTIYHTDKQSGTVARIFNCSPYNLVLCKVTKMAAIASLNVAKDCQHFRLPSDEPTMKKKIATI